MSVFILSIMSMNYEAFLLFLGGCLNSSYCNFLHRSAEIALPLLVGMNHLIKKPGEGLEKFKSPETALKNLLIKS